MRASILPLLGLALVMSSSAAAPDVRAAAPLQRALPWPSERIAEGVELFRADGATLGSPDAPQAVRLLRLDPRRVRLASALAGDDIPDRATVLQIAERTRAIAAVNAGFFSPAGEPTGLLKVDGRLVSDTSRARGAVALIDTADRQQLLFDRVSARVRLRAKVEGRWRTVPVDGVDTVRGAGRLVLYSPASGATTDTTGGLEWTLRGAPLRTSGPRREGDSAIPSDGYVLSYGGGTAPALLVGLGRATAVHIRESIAVRSGQRVRDWLRAPTIVGGAGLLLRNGVALTDWRVEQLSKGFETTRHPRTVVATDRDGSIWLLTVDGRQPGRATGMTFGELQDLLARLGAVNALNLDGGGSTTMVVGGSVVNRPSDLVGPRPISDALIVVPANVQRRARD